MSSLTESVLRCDIAGIKAAIAAGEDVNERVGGHTPLVWAVFRGDVEGVRLLLENGADPNLRGDANDPSSCPLWHAEDDFGL